MQFKPNIKLISASAGTGKTYNLIKGIDVALKGTDPKKIVAITFTRAATRDIRDKVNVDDINVNTIHGFFTGILREQSLYFKHSTNFNILEEFDDKALFQDVAVDILIKKAKDVNSQNFFAEYDFENVVEMLQKMESHYAVIRDKIVMDVDLLLKEEKEAEYEKLKQILPDELDAMVIGPILRTKGADADKLEMIRKSVAPIVSKFIPVRDMSSFNVMVSLIKELPKCSPGSSGSAKNWGASELAAIKVALKVLNDIKKEVVETYRLGEVWVTKEAAENRKKFFELFTKVHTAYMKKKKELDVLSYNDIELFTHDLVKNDPRVALFYREKYDHVFVDEFQDTNKMQRDVLFQISKQLFLVGDAKQSIYRFRNADVRVFIDTQGNCGKGDLEELRQNRRCLPSIIDAVNEAFPRILGKGYLKFEPFRNEGKGVVRLINADSGNKYHNSFDHALEARICLDIINDRINNAKRTYKDFAILFRASDHMLEFERLFRDKGIPFVVYGGGSRNDLTCSLRSLFKVILDPNDDYSMLETLKLPYFYMDDQDIYNAKSKAGTIWEGLKDDSHLKKFILEMRSKKDKGSFAEFVAEALNASRFIQSASLIFTGQEVGAAEAILRAARHVESKGEGIEYFLDLVADMKEENMGKDIDAVKLMTVHASKGLEFNTVLLPCLDVGPRPARQSLVMSKDGDVAVKLGDEETNKKITTVRYRNIRELDVEADLEESKRVFYVAMTRAMDELYMISDFNKGKGLEGNRWVDWIADVFKDKIENDFVVSDASVNSQKRKIVRTVGAIDEIVEHVKQQKRWTVSQIKEKFEVAKHFTSFGQKGIGNIIHSLLSNWDDAELVDRIYKALGNAAGNIKPILDSFASSDIGKKILCHPHHFSEYGFTVKIDQNIVCGRIDRINIYDDHVWVIDYKTGLGQQDLISYNAQLYYYMQFAQRNFKDKKVLGSIIDVVECKEYPFL